jgi:hypothetical protein
MYKEDVSSTTLAFLAGAAVGAGVMLLLAPQTGPEFRSSVLEYTRKAKDEWDQMRGEGGSTFGTMVQRSKEWIQSAMQSQPREGGDEAPESALESGQSGTPIGGGTRQDT